ncbi:MAG TPA: PTS sugar transporter subunit IIA [Pyrinomonadaceae bacterium]|nr:PTS sugar transporter subunit IIA [Chloracidobacterium sp.]MBP9935946.1 PTS sugar transporter subunit IIA [Pyrinomonadaceae bacterium]MBK7803840.1 PTS sugar transporter subunit IIA [Chloracidobacterium sp.]MBK9439487.1 PTS sugar transporter subunit IIA [Chloracidobacterium sp.]MBL0239224.1 PTS sugar transporter subunit IIA [Chloracidobacterium sp.]
MENDAKIGGVIVSHGQMANELLAAAEEVVGDLTNIAAVSIGWHDDVETARDEIERAISNMSFGSGVLILTDMFGGTPTNISAMFLKEDEVEIVTGVNLPMVIKLATDTRPIGLKQMAADVEEEGKSAICRAGELLSPAKPK